MDNDIQLNTESTEQALKTIFNKLQELEKRQKKIESQQRKVIRLQTKGRTYSEEEKEEQLMTKLGQKVANSPNGVNTNQVKSLFDCSKPTALNKMRELDEESERINYVSKGGRKADRLKHERFSLGRMC